MTDLHAEIDAILDPIKVAHPGISNAEVVEHLPEHLQQPFWERAVDRYLEAELAKIEANVASADALAERAHHGQVDKAGNPYIDHPRAVAASLAEHGDNAVMAGLLHDVVEDSDITLDDLRELGYPPEVVAAVDSVTRRLGETYMELIHRAAADPLGRLIKLADNAHNSDESRLAKLDPEQAAWFRQKYAKAREVLTAAGRKDGS